MTLRFRTAHASYFGDDRVDITRSGCDGYARERREEAPGAIFAPSADLVYPVIMRIFPGAMALLRAKDPAGMPLLEALWPAYTAWYKAEMRVSHGLLRRDYGPLEELAYKRGVRPAHDRWAWWLGQERATFVCECTFKLGGSVMCHRVILGEILVALGAVYEGEVGKEAGK